MPDKLAPQFHYLGAKVRLLQRHPREPSGLSHVAGFHLGTQQWDLGMSLEHVPFDLHRNGVLDT